MVRYPVRRTRFFRRVSIPDEPGGSSTPGNRTAETGLAGWGGRIRACKCRFEKYPLKCRNEFPCFRNISGPETIRAVSCENPDMQLADSNSPVMEQSPLIEQ